MATPASPKSGTTTQSKKPKSPAASSNGRNGHSSNGHAKSASQTNKKTSDGRRNNGRRKAEMPKIPTWIGVVASMVGAGLVAGYYASQKGWFNRANNWADDFSAAFADGETDEDNFDQTRSAGRGAMRDDHDEWDDIDDNSDASFPASDPPSFNPGTA